jgi:hypothetical protein
LISIKLIDIGQRSNLVLLKYLQYEYLFHCHQHLQTIIGLFKNISFIKTFNAEKVEIGFKYTSDENSEWETVESLREKIRIHVDSKFII